MQQAGPPVAPARVFDALSTLWPDRAHGGVDGQSGVEQHQYSQGWGQSAQNQNTIYRVQGRIYRRGNGAVPPGLRTKITCSKFPRLFPDSLAF